jgi:hypothetical protein
MLESSEYEGLESSLGAPSQDGLRSGVPDDERITGQGAIDKERHASHTDFPAFHIRHNPI